MRCLSPGRFAAAVLGLLLVPALSVVAAETSPKDLDAAWTKAMKANSLDAVVACYAPDAVLWLPDAPQASGTTAIRATYEGLLAANTVQDVTLGEVHYKTSGDVSASWGNFVLTLAPRAGGAAIVMKGRFTGIAERRGGRWVYVADHASADPVPPPAK